MTRVATQEGDPPRVAYAVNRSVGNAVARNRLRRQLRAVVRAHGTQLAAGHTYLIGVSASAAGATYQQLHASVTALVRATEDER
jgi:ribonuclease P protein component